MPVERIVDDPAAAAASMAAGGRLMRHSVVMVLDLEPATHAPLVSDGFSIAPMSLDRVIEYGAVVGVVSVTETTASGTCVARPFVTDICVDPAVAGQRLGSALLAASAGRLADLGWSTLTLVVTVGNPAQRVYERLGFRVTSESWRIETTDRPD